MGLAIITTDSSGFRETLVERDNGFVGPVKSSDALVAAMRHFIEDPLLVDRMGPRSSHIVGDRYDVRKINAKILREMRIAERSPCAWLLTTNFLTTRLKLTPCCAC
jgi:glycosyltransferase involved in cell wall biosynthesis